ncbi:MAG: hypothetical protein JXA30_03975 [Deltaproteobacteria bacterium]|nr:hypothetical protein [Deltaproteobacteria bacterium]
MKIQLLIDSIVQQTTVLIAKLATAGGARSPLAHIANQVMVELASELESQGLSRKVTADMFGISLRSYRRRVQRMRESSSVRGRTLWEAVLEFVKQGSLVTRRQVFDRFCRDEEEHVRGILHDLVESGLLFCSGAGLDGVYRLATEQELKTIYELDGQSGLEELIWSIVFCRGPILRDRVAEIGALSEDALDKALRNLTETGRINVEQRDDGVYLFSDRFLIEQSDEKNWEASVYDHFHAVVRTICNRLEPGICDSRFRDSIGGSTYTFDVGPGHPHEKEVLSLLRDFRERCGGIRQRVSVYNQQHGLCDVGENVVVYIGQSVIPREKNSNGDDLCIEKERA